LEKRLYAERHVTPGFRALRAQFGPTARFSGGAEQREGPTAGI